MGGFFGAVSKEDCVFDLFFGVDYHSHLGTRRAGMAVYDSESGFDKAIHNIENAPFRTKFTKESNSMHGQMGIGCISDFEAQPILIRSHHGTYAISTVGKINNIDEIADEIIKTNTHFFEMHGGGINQTELVAAIINQKENFIEGIRYVQEVVDGSISILILTPKGVYAVRDKLGRTPISIGQKEDGYCASFESFAYLNLGYKEYKELGPGEAVVLTPDGVKTLIPAGDKMRICTFLWIYYGYPSASYEGISVEKMRYNCGKALAKRDNVKPDIVAGVPDSGIAHAIGYSNEAGIPYSRPFIKYTPTWPRSFMPTNQTKRNLIAKMKLIPIHDLIDGKSLLLIDDSIVRGTQLRETTEYLFESGAKEVHIRPACPPLFYGCKYLNFSRSTSEMDLITRRVIKKLEGVEPTDEIIKEYVDPDGEKYAAMIEEIRKELHFTTLRYHRLDDMIASVGIDSDKLCTYCWDGKE
ncbi:amidophosphoribosyltransferase [uncultured Eubacterium sp.]|uniref:amidophosphoribosyltransferase n=1 Tax=uncultured Eubacterium sp. TaxID=165185 RepID=UPI0025EA466F|nr:amidophosphoribosyltransferase [uncultured Eubacterium sp.]